MSLDDQFNKNDGSLIDRVDSFILGIHKKLGEFWQNKTYRSSDDLKRGLYGISASSIGANSLMTHSYLSAILTFLPLIQAVTNGGISPKSTVGLEVNAESMGLPKKTWKYGYLFALGVGSAIGLRGLSRLGIYLHNGNPILLQKGVGDLTDSVGLMSWISADYLNRVKIDPPPKKPKKAPFPERIKEKIKSIMPSPSPKPIPGRI